MPCKYYKLRLSFKNFILFPSWIVLAHFALSHCNSRTKFHLLCKLPCNISEEKNTLKFVICHINNSNCSSYSQEGQSIMTFPNECPKAISPIAAFYCFFSKWQLPHSEISFKKINRNVALKGSLCLTLQNTQYRR